MSKDNLYKSHKITVKNTLYSVLVKLSSNGDIDYISIRNESNVLSRRGVGNDYPSFKAIYTHYKNEDFKSQIREIEKLYTKIETKPIEVDETVLGDKEYSKCPNLILFNEFFKAPTLN